MSGAELLVEPSCLGTAGIDVEARTDIGGAISCVFVVAISEVGAWSMLSLGLIMTGKSLNQRIFWVM